MFVQHSSLVRDFISADAASFTAFVKGAGLFNQIKGLTPILSGKFAAIRRRS